MMSQYEHRKPNFRVIIARPNYMSSGAYAEEIIGIFESNADNKILLSYTYKQDVASFESPFSLTFTPEEVNAGGDTIMEIIRLADIVKIEEYGIMKYVGVVTSPRYVKTATGDAPDRMISVSGTGIGGILSRFSIMLDQIVLASANKTIESMNNKLSAYIQELSATYGENASMSHIFGKIMDAFKLAQEEVGGFQKGTGIYKVVEKYMKFSPEAERLTTKYPMALTAFSYGGNTLLSVLQELVFKPFYEFFFKWDETNHAFLLTLRPTPYDPVAWVNLRTVNLEPVRITGLDVGFSDTDVKTWFFAYLTGGALSYENARARAQAYGYGKDSERWAMYGYRPLECVFKYVDYEMLKEKEGNIAIGSTPDGDALNKVKSGQTVSDDKLMAEYTKKLQQWYKRADQMLTGSITEMTSEKCAYIGEKIRYNGVEFYVEVVDGSWNYGAEMQTKYTVTRGGVYNNSFNTNADEGGSNWFFRKAIVKELR